MTYNSQVGYYIYGDGGCGIKPHAVTMAGSNDYTYDCNGNMEIGAGRTILNNFDNKPSSITIGGATNYFFYDYQGQRVKKIANGTPTVYIGKLYECTIGTCTKYIFGGITRIDLKPPAEPKDLLAFGGVVSERGNQEVPFGAIGTNFIADVYAKQTIENEQRVALKSSTAICGSNILYYHTDHLGSSNVITNVSGGNAEGVYYYPFGATRLQTGGDCVNHKFTGQEEDSETGLYYYGARYYDPVLGRFISADTIVPDFSNPQSLNRYSYVLNNPLKYTDPTGHFNYGDNQGDFETAANVDPNIGDVSKQTAPADTAGVFGVINGLVDKLESWWADPLGTKGRGGRGGYGYGDINITSIGVFSILGGTFSFQITEEGRVYVCPGLAVGTPGTSLSATMSNYDPSQGFIAAAQLSVAAASGQVGYSFATESFFGEVGGAFGFGFSLTGAYCLGPFGPFDAKSK
jgi:RHS repeat-associated protein